MAHTNEKVCLTVLVFLVRDGKVLLAHHAKYDRWLGIGGHIDPGEDPDEALYKEIREETGLTASEVVIHQERPGVLAGLGTVRQMLLVPAFMDRHRAGDREHVALVYLGSCMTDREVLVSEEHKALRWFTRDELERGYENLQGDTAWYALRALEAAELSQTPI